MVLTESFEGDEQTYEMDLYSGGSSAAVDVYGTELLHWAAGRPGFRYSFKSQGTTRWMDSILGGGLSIPGSPISATLDSLSP